MSSGLTNYVSIINDNPATTGYIYRIDSVEQLSDQGDVKPTLVHFGVGISMPVMNYGIDVSKAFDAVNRVIPFSVLRPGISGIPNRKSDIRIREVFEVD